MRHKWKKIKNRYIIEDNMHKKYDIGYCKKCIRCGLMKSESYNIPIYFKDGVLLSKYTIPYECFKPIEFITKEEFSV